MKRLLDVCLLVMLVASCDRDPGTRAPADSRTSPARDALPKGHPPEGAFDYLAAHPKAVWDRLGAHASSTNSRVSLSTEGIEVYALEEEFRVIRDKRGSFWASHQRSDDRGREIYFLDGRLLLRPRHGKFHRRQPRNRFEPEELFVDFYKTTAAQVEVLAAGVQQEQTGSLTHDGRQANQVLLRFVQQAPPSAGGTWRDRARVFAAEGTLIVDSQTGVVLSGKISGALSFSQGGKTYTMKLESSHGISKIGADHQIEAPEEDVIVELKATAGETEPPVPSDTPKTKEDPT